MQLQVCMVSNYYLSPILFWAISSTTPGSARMLIMESPISSISFDAILRRIRRTTLPERFLGISLKNWILPRTEIGPISERTTAFNSLRIFSSLSFEFLSKITNAYKSSPFYLMRITNNSGFYNCRMRK